MSLISQNFIDTYRARGIILDDFQLRAIEALDGGRDVLVSAPTGAGKTVVAEYAVELALANLIRCVYTAPIKALSNQKFRDLAERIGAEHVGLLTGDQTVNRDAPILVVTTEVLRNMLFQRDEMLESLGFVVLDEVHYLADEFRGPVWEEIILQLPAHTRLVSLSATISNLEEFSAWLRSVRGATEVVHSAVRPVPLEQHVAISRQILPLYDDEGRVSKPLRRAAARVSENDRFRRRRKISFGRRKRIIGQLREADMLPAIEFIFSRKGCDNAVADLLDSGMWLNNPEQARAVRARARELRKELTEEDARAVRFNFWAKAMERGFGAHHAGMFPALKELAEDLMEEGLLKLVYATGTLALGIDMPVRTVVLEELTRFNGSDFTELSATEYTQLIGRAGRRGKDKVGHAIVLHTDEVNVDHLAKLGSGRVEPLNSAFFPSYNSVVNLLAYYDFEQARQIMGTSFAQYQADADVGEAQARMARMRKQMSKLEADLHCSRGDLVEYLHLHAASRRASKAERKRAKAAYREKLLDSWDAATTGHLYAFAREGELEYGVVLSVGRRLRLVNLYGEIRWLALDELSSELRDLGKIALPFGRSFKDADVREQIGDDIYSRIEDRLDLRLDGDLELPWERFAARENPKLIAHPVHSCPHLEQHLDDAAPYLALMQRLEDLERRTKGATESVAREFDATAAILARLGYLQPGTGKDAMSGRVKLAGGAQFLRHIHSEADLLIVESVGEAAFADLTPAEFAGVCSAFLCDRRLGTQVPREPKLREAWVAIFRNLQFLADGEETYHISRTGTPYPGAMEAFYQWASGASLESVLEASGLVVGDFISANRRLIDLLGQFTQVGDPHLEELAAQARDLVRRWQWI